MRDSQVRSLSQCFGLRVTFGNVLFLYLKLHNSISVMSLWHFLSSEANFADVHFRHEHGVMTIVTIALTLSNTLVLAVVAVA